LEKNDPDFGFQIARCASACAASGLRIENPENSETGSHRLFSTE
jgi:hypothetical protein